ncbi:MAG: class I SAM-dependent methyltransferase, partial [Fibrobacteres bacterium]|nr:class I SAM-dependent methyltransferase [Fibrobacterota bacterium]
MKPEFETDYNKRIYQVYNAARSLPEDTKRLWMDEISKYISNNSNLTFLDLGSGTGRFSSLIADHFTCNVIGIEPSEKMLETAHSSNRNPNVKFTKGDAYNIPEADSFFSFAWLSMVIHHIADKDRCAKELSRVLRKDGLIF